MTIDIEEAPADLEEKLELPPLPTGALHGHTIFSPCGFADHELTHQRTGQPNGDGSFIFTFPVDDLILTIVRVHALAVRCRPDAAPVLFPIDAAAAHIGNTLEVRITL